jgi:hypothetical protein
LRVIFSGRHQAGHLELEATEMLVRSAMHHAGATVLTKLLQFPAPSADQRIIACSCGHSAHYRELRSKPVQTVVGKVEVSRPYYLCPHCHAGQFPADVELDIENREFSPGVRRMQAIVGQEAPFDHGRQQMKLLADLEVTTKAVERTAEAIGEDIAAGEREQMRRAVQLDLPIVLGEAVPILYVQMDGTGVPVVKKETVGRQGKTEGQPSHTREVKLGCVFTQTTWDEEGYPIRDPGFHYLHRSHRDRRRVWQADLRRSLEERLEPRGKKVVMGGPNGSGILPSNTFQARCRLSICFTRASTGGRWRADCTPTTTTARKLGSRSNSEGSTKAKSRSS